MDKRIPATQIQTWAHDLLKHHKHALSCASLRSYMAGGVSTQVDVTPSACTVSPPCDCGAKDVEYK